MRLERTAFAVFAVVSVGLLVSGHELCLDTSGPVPVASAPSQGLCADLGYQRTCCSTSALVTQVQEVFQGLSFQADDQAQADLCSAELKKLVCSRCDAWGAHLFGAEGSDAYRELPFMCSDYCSQVYSACSDVLITASSGSTLFSANTTFRISDNYGSSQSFCSTFGPETVSDGVSSFCFSGSEFVPSTADDGADDEFVDHLCFKPVLGSPDSSIFIFMESVPNYPDYVVLGRRSGLIELYRRSPSENVMTSLGAFADLRSMVVENGEKGMLGLAFHPTEPLFYVSYSCSNERCSVPCGTSNGCHVIPNSGCSESKCTGQDHVSAIDEFSYTFSNNGTSTIQFSREIFRLAQPFGNHNGGQVIFDRNSDKPLLMIMIGDGGSRADPLTSGQTAATLLGKILRIDIESTSNDKNYSIPEDNPFISSEAESLGFFPEIYAYGFRNPWRCSFDKDRPEYFLCGDVGQNAREEISLVTKGGNYGWDRMEGSIFFEDTVFQRAPGQSSAVAIPPILEYAHSLNPSGSGHSICGGYFIRGSDMDTLIGAYIYADYRGPLFNARETFEGSGVFSTEQVGWACSNSSELDCPSHTGTIYSFAEDVSGRVFLLTDSGVLEIVPQNQCDFSDVNWNSSKSFNYEVVWIPILVVGAVIAMVGGGLWYRRRGGCKAQNKYQAQPDKVQS